MQGLSSGKLILTNLVKNIVQQIMIQTIVLKLVIRQIVILSTFIASTETGKIILLLEQPRVRGCKELTGSVQTLTLLISSLMP